MLRPVTTTMDRMADADVAWLHMDRPDNLKVVPGYPHLSACSSPQR